MTPLDYRHFFTGEWRGEGELRPSPWLRWLLPVEKVRAVSRPPWLPVARMSVEVRRHP